MTTYARRKAEELMGSYGLKADDMYVRDAVFRDHLEALIRQVLEDAARVCETDEVGMDGGWHAELVRALADRELP